MNECFGEAWMNSSNKGAVAYIGNATTTYLTFGVAEATGNIDPAAPFNAYQTGFFDAFMNFDNMYLGEIINATKTTVSQIPAMYMYKYRHIISLTLLGDPSLTPYLGIPLEQTVSYQTLQPSDITFEINTTPSAYVSLTDTDGILHGAGYTDENGHGIIDITPFNSSNVKLCITARMKIPYFETIDLVGIENNYELSIMNYELKQNYPNPFNPNTLINYELRITDYEFAEIVVHNSIGQQIWSSGNLPFTIHHSPLYFDGSKFNSGIYYYSLIVDGKKMDTKAMLLIK